MRIAICDDSTPDAQFVKDIVSGWARGKSFPLDILIFSSAESFLFHYAEDKDFDILLLDIEMSHMDGVTMARQIRQDNETVQIVFITGYSDYIAEGYEVAALHYLMKPVSPEKLCSVLDRAADKIVQNEKCLTLELSGETVRIPLHEIRYLDVAKNYVTVHAKQDHTVKCPLAELEKRLDERFCRVGRSQVLNLKYIRRVTKTQVFLSDDTILPLPRGTYESLNRAIIQYT